MNHSPSVTFSTTTKATLSTGVDTRASTGPALPSLVMAIERAVRGLAAGRVQGVFYRASFQQEAKRLGLVGWVHNLPDGRVEFFVQGDAQAVEQLLDWAAQGPRGARVGHVEVHESSMDPDLQDCEIRF
jgi:acylphosphatase